MNINTSMMQNFGLKHLSHVQSRRNLLKYLVRVEMASDWFTRIYQSVLAKEINIQNRDMACKLGCGLFLSPQWSHFQKLSMVSLVCSFVTFSKKIYICCGCSPFTKLKRGLCNAHGVTYEIECQGCKVRTLVKQPEMPIQEVRSTRGA